LVIVLTFHLTVNPKSILLYFVCKSEMYVKNWAHYSSVDDLKVAPPNLTKMG